MILEGGALVGKTRLALEWASGLEPRWFAGWLCEGHGDEAIARITEYGEDTVVIMDGPSSQELERICERLSSYDQSGRQTQVRVLVIDRSAEGLRRRFTGESADVLKAAPTTSLQPWGSENDHWRWFRELSQHYAKRLGVAVPRVDYQYIPKRQVLPIGLLHVAALTAVQSLVSPSSNLILDDLLHALWESGLMTRRRSNDASDWGLTGISSYQLECAVIALALVRPRDVQSCVKTLGWVPELEAIDASSLRNVARFAHHLFPSIENVDPLVVDVQPELMLAAEFTRLSADGSLGEPFLRQLDDEGAQRCLSVFMRSVSLLPSVVPWISAVIGTNKTRLGDALSLSADASQVFLDDEFARTITRLDWDDQSLNEIRARFSDERLPSSALTICELQLRRASLMPNEQMPEREARLAALLADKSQLLGEAGVRTEEVLSTSAKAVEIAGRLATTAAELFEPLYVSTLITRSNCLGAMGQHPAALDAVSEAIGILERRADDSNDSLGSLGDALLVQAKFRSKLYGQADALQYVSRAVELFRQLVNRESKTYERRLGMALIAQTSCLLGVPGRHQEAVEPVRMAVLIFQRLAEDDQALYEPTLAGALLTEGQVLSREPKSRAAAAEAISQAVDIFKRLTQGDPQRYGMHLGGAQMSLSACLGAGGAHPTRALAASKAAVQVFERLAQVNSSSYAAGLADARINYSLDLQATGQHARALAELEAAIETYSELALMMPARYAASLYEALTGQARLLAARLGKLDRAMNVIDGALAHYSEFNAHKPELAPQHARMMKCKAHICWDLGRLDEAILLSREVLAVYKGLAKADATDWGQAVSEQSLFLRRLLAEAGKTHDSLTEGLGT